MKTLEKYKYIWVPDNFKSFFFNATVIEVNFSPLKQVKNFKHQFAKQADSN